MTDAHTTPRRRIRTTVAGAVAAVALAAGLAAPASSMAETPTVLTIEAQAGGFFGYVVNDDAACESAERTVSLYKVKGNGSKKMVGSDLAQPNGPDLMYSISTAKKGKFFAKVPAIPGCSAAKSAIAYAQA